VDNSKYFYRRVVFTRKGNQVSLVDINQLENTSLMEDWMGTVVSLADGKHSIAQLIDYLGQQYPQKPENLAETLHSVIERLLEGEMIELSDDPVELPYYLSAPIESLDVEKAKRLIAEEEAEESV